MTDYYKGLPRRPCLDFTLLEELRRAHGCITDAELAYALRCPGNQPPASEEQNTQNSLDSGARGG